ncbi:MAG: glucose-1-phosphate thymidylyltransferase RfbA [Myxococcales bacterium]|nr:glucose-1-phosphate thymidylyltransferase RfbA [Myxococcales bacterium]
MGKGTDKGIVFAGGSGTRLHPLTLAVNKQLTPVFDKPMVYYPLAVLMLAGIRNVHVISTPHDVPLFERLLGDGSQWGMTLSYGVQEEPGGIAQAFSIASEFIAGERVALVLGDNVFYGHGLHGLLMDCAARTEGTTVFGYYVRDPERYGVAELDAAGRVVGLEEKPRAPKSSYAVPGLYFYDEHATALAATLTPSARGELEITDLNRLYLERGSLHFEKLGRGIAWLDTGTPEALLQASQFIFAIQSRQGLQVSCPEEIAFRKGWIDEASLRRLGERLEKTAYGQYLLGLLAG